jgi:hypothetical protein
MRDVRLLVALMLAVTAATGVGASAGSAPESVRSPLVRLFERPDGHGDRLARVDPRTLRPVSPGLRTFLDGFGGTFSPDGRMFAYGNGFDGRALVQLIDVQRWSTRARMNLGGDGPVAVAWPTQDRLIAVTGEGFGRQRLLVLAAPRGEVLARRSFRGRRLADAATPLGLVTLLAPDRGIGPARILHAGVDGDLRTFEVARIRAGGNEGRRRGGRFRAPGLTVDPDAGAADLVAAGPMLVARIDLASGAVAYHELEAVGPVGRAVAAKDNVAAWWRYATWLGDGRIAVTGHYEPPLRPGRRLRPANRPFGVRLIDTRDWTIRTLHPDAMFVHRARERLLANGTTWYAGWRRSRSTGLLAFDMQGRRVFTRFRGADVSVLGSHGPLAYVWVRPTRMLHVLDLRSGTSLRRQRVGPGHLPFLFSPTEATSGS